MRSHVFFPVLVATIAYLAQAAPVAESAVEGSQSFARSIIEEENAAFEEEQYLKPGTYPGRHPHSPHPKVEIGNAEDEASVFERYIHIQDVDVGEAVDERHRQPGEDADDMNTELYIYT